MEPLLASMQPKSVFCILSTCLLVEFGLHVPFLLPIIDN